jgi:general secretion pathway protein N
MAGVEMTNASLNSNRLMLIAVITIVGFVPGSTQERGGSEMKAHPVASVTPFGKAATSQHGSGNPLWSIPMNSLVATRTRPIFAPSRRPPARSVTAPTSSSLRPPLALVGTIAANDGSIAILFDETTKRTVRLRTGESHHGWTLQQLKGREATLQKGKQRAVLYLANSGR